MQLTHRDVDFKVVEYSPVSVIDRLFELREGHPRRVERPGLGKRQNAVPVDDQVSPDIVVSPQGYPHLVSRRDHIVGAYGGVCQRVGPA